MVHNSTIMINRKYFKFAKISIHVMQKTTEKQKFSKNELCLHRHNGMNTKRNDLNQRQQESAKHQPRDIEKNFCPLYIFQ